MADIQYKAVKCTTCGLMVGPGDYGRLTVCTPGEHVAETREDGFAVETDAYNLRKGEVLCPGSELLGHTKEVEYDGLNGTFVLGTDWRI